jgi:hypothetical protein
VPTKRELLRYKMIKRCDWQRDGAYICSKSTKNALRMGERLLRVLALPDLNAV